MGLQWIAFVCSRVSWDLVFACEVSDLDKADSLRSSAFVCSDSRGSHTLGLWTVGSEVLHLAGLLPFEIQGGQGLTHGVEVLG